MKTKHILVVGTRSDAERKFLTEMHPQWAVVFAETGAETMQWIERAPVHAILTDQTLPDMDGFSLLDEVMHQQPDIQRFIFADFADASSAIKSVGFAHQTVPRPWHSAVLTESIERSFSINAWLSNTAARKLMSRMTVVPSPPDLYFEVVRALNSPDGDIEQVISHAELDPAMTAKLLKVANSAALGLRHEVNNVAQAISFLGLETTRSVILLAHTFSYCDRVRAAGFSIERLWEHSLRAARMARQIARCEFAPRRAMEECFLAGVLHDLGELLLAVNLPEEYGKVLAVARQGGSIPHWEIEAEHLGATHAEVGAELMAAWNLPLTVVEAIALHHRPTQLMSTGFRPLTAVHAADVIAEEPGAELDEAYLRDLGMAGNLEKWREVCDEKLAVAC
jgi:HD-like signal output (HDOD) protein